MFDTDTQEMYAILVAETERRNKQVVLDACKLFIKKNGAKELDRGKRPPIPKAWIEVAWRRQKYKCNICKEEMHLSEAAGDHIEPWSQGGEHKQSNIAAVHDVKFGGTCNQEKGARGLVDESKRTGTLFKDTLPGDELNVYRTGK